VNDESQERDGDKDSEDDDERRERAADSVLIAAAGITLQRSRLGDQSKVDDDQAEYEHNRASQGHRARSHLGRSSAIARLGLPPC
jgi:hypothetical protein